MPDFPVSKNKMYVHKNQKKKLSCKPYKVANKCAVAEKVTFDNC